MKGHIVDRAGKRVLGIQQKSVVLIKDKRSKKLLRIGDQVTGAGKYGYGPPGPGMPGGERGSGMGAAGLSPGGGGGGISIPSTVWVDIDKVGTMQSVRLAEE